MEKRKNKKVGMNYGKNKKNYRGNVQGNYGSARSKGKCRNG